jgi:hypothetical protein
MYVNINKTYVLVECYKCGVVFAVSEKFDNGRRKDKESFYCPNGHRQAYVKGTVQILNEKIEQKDRELLDKSIEIEKLNRELKKKNKVKKIKK